MPDAAKQILTDTREAEQKFLQALGESAQKAIQEHDEDDGYILMPQVLQMPEVQEEVSDPRSAAAVAKRVMMEKVTALEESGW